MAGNLVLQDRCFVGMAREVTYGTDPGVDGTDGIYVEAPSTEMTVGNIARLGASPYAPGWKDIPGLRSFSHSGTTEICAMEIADANSRPLYDPVLALCGFDIPAYAAGPPQTLTYTRKTNGPTASVSVVHEWYEEDYSEVFQRKGQGVRGSGTIKWRYDDRLLITYAGQGAAMEEDQTAATGSIDYTDTSGESPLGLVGHSSTITTLQDLDTLSAYTGKAREFNIDLAMNPVVVRGADAAGLPSKVLLIPGPITGTLVIERVPIDEWDPRTYQISGIPIEYSHRFTDVEDSDLYIDIDMYLNIRSVDYAEEDGILLWSLDVKGLWAGSPAGVTPGTDMTITVTDAS